MDFGAASASGLSALGGGAPPGVPVALGPDLWEDMGEQAFVGALNAWGSDMHREVVALRTDLSATQVSVSGAFVQAQEAVRELVAQFRIEVLAMRQTTMYEAQQSLSRLEHVVEEARARFGEQDARFSSGLGELAHRLQDADAWAQAEPARVAAIVHAAAPGTPPQRDAQPLGAGVGRMGSPGWAAGTSLPQQQPPQHQQQQQPPDAWAAAAARLAAAAAAATAARATQPQPQPDAWAQQPQAAATPGVGCGVSPQGWRQGPTHFEINTPGFMGGGGKGGNPYPREPREMRLDARGWTSLKLDVGVAADVFHIWKDRAMMFLSRDRPDVRKLLSWAETQSQEDLQQNLATQAAAFNVLDLAAVEYALHDGIKLTLQDTLLGRARGCIERGCELWRTLCAEWSGSAPQLQAAKARRYMYPPTCKNIQELWSRLSAWERLGEEVDQSGFTIAPWLAITALDQLIPTQLRDSLTSRAGTGGELKTYPQRLAWVKLQMEHARGLSQATAFAPLGKDASGDVNMYSVDEPPGLGPDATIASMSWAMAESVQAGDWDTADTLQGAIYAMKGTKGSKGARKGLGKGKGLGKDGGAAPAAAAKGGGETFQGVCNHCGKWGHRRQDCRKLTAELEALGKGKGKSGGKGGPTGGKGPPATLAEVGADDNWAGDMLTGAIAGAAAEFDEWDFATAAVCSLRADTAPGKTAGASASTRLAQQYTGRGPSAPTSAYTGLGPSTPTSAYTGLGPSTSITPSAAPRGHAVEVRRTGKTTLPEMCATKPHKQLEYERLLQRQQRFEHERRLQQQRQQQQQQTKTQNSFAALSLLTDASEELLAAVSGDAGAGQVIEAVVDSGAVHSVTPPGWFPGPTVASPWSRAGRGYRAANGTAIKNLGQVTVKFATAAGDKCSIPFQVAEVEQPLLSVAHLTSAGNRVELGHDSGRVVNLTTGRAIALERRGGVYIMRMFIADGVAPAPAPFRRQGA
jgi:hypothetical protein